MKPRAVGDTSARCSWPRSSAGSGSWMRAPDEADEAEAANSAVAAAAAEGRPEPSPPHGEATATAGGRGDRLRDLSRAIAANQANFETNVSNQNGS